MLQFAGDLGGGLEQFRALDEASLHPEFHVILHQAFHGFHHQLRTQFHQLVVQGARRVRRLHPTFRAQDDTAGVDAAVNHEGGDAGDVLPVDHGPVDRRSATVLRKQGGVQVERAPLGHSPDHLRQHPEAHDYKEIGLPGGQVAEELLVLELFRLQQRQAMLHGVFLDGALVHLESAAGRLVGHRNHTHHIVSAFDKGVQRAHREFRRSHIDNRSISEHTEEFTFCTAPPGFEQVYMQDTGILDGLVGKERPDGRQDEGRCKLADESGGAAVVGQALAGDIHHPVQHEEQDGDDGRRTQAAFFDNGPDRCADKEQQHAGQGFGDLVPDLYVRPVDEMDVVVHFEDLSTGILRRLPGRSGRIFKGGHLLSGRTPLVILDRRHGFVFLLPPG